MRSSETGVSRAGPSRFSQTYLFYRRMTTIIEFWPSKPEQRNIIIIINKTGYLRTQVLEITTAIDAYDSRDRRLDKPWKQIHCILYAHTFETSWCAVGSNPGPLHNSRIGSILSCRCSYPTINPRINFKRNSRSVYV